MKLNTIILSMTGCIGLVTNAHAEFSGAYDPTQWAVSNTNGGNGTAVAAASALQLTSSNFTNFDDAPLDASTLSFSILVAQATTISFDWNYVTHDDSGSGNDTFGYAVGGTAVQLSRNGSFAPQSGTRAVFVDAGQTFSFQTTSTDNLFGSAVTTVGSFNAISAVPEPESLWFVLAGLPLLAAVSRRRRAR